MGNAVVMCQQSRFVVYKILSLVLASIVIEQWTAPVYCKLLRAFGGDCAKPPPRGSFALPGHFSLYEVSQGIDLGWGAGACDDGNGLGVVAVRWVVDAVQVVSEVGGSLR